MNKNEPVDMVTIGESMVLIQPMSEGSLQYAPLFTKSIAGAESNVAIGLSRLGKKARWISRLGADPFGDSVMSVLAGEGIDVSKVLRNTEAPTAIYFKEFKGYGDPNVFYYRKNSAASLLAPEDIQPEWFEGARHLHVTGITPALGEQTEEAVKEAIKTAKSMGLSVSFDPNLRRKLWSEERARHALLSIIPLCDLFLPGMEEAEFLLGEGGTPEQYGAKFLEMGTKAVVLKLGEKGSIGFCGSETFQAEPHRVSRVVDTVGAGDAFAAGLLSVLLEEERIGSEDEIKRRLESALQRANLMGALATQYKGDWEGLPTLKEIEGLEAGRQITTR